jgi:transcriptional regulator with XRE-family HTH domain
MSDAPHEVTATDPIEATTGSDHQQALLAPDTPLDEQHDIIEATPADQESTAEQPLNVGASSETDASTLDHPEASDATPDNGPGASVDNAEDVALHEQDLMWRKSERRPAIQETVGLLEENEVDIDSVLKNPRHQAVLSDLLDDTKNSSQIAREHGMSGRTLSRIESEIISALQSAAPDDIKAALPQPSGQKYIDARPLGEKLKALKDDLGLPTTHIANGLFIDRGKAREYLSGSSVPDPKVLRSWLNKIGVEADQVEEIMAAHQQVLDAHPLLFIDKGKLADTPGIIASAAAGDAEAKRLLYAAIHKHTAIVARPIRGLPSFGLTQADLTEQIRDKILDNTNSLFDGVPPDASPKDRLRIVRRNLRSRIDILAHEIVSDRAAPQPTEGQQEEPPVETLPRFRYLNYDSTGMLPKDRLREILTPHEQRVLLSRASGKSTDEIANETDRKQRSIQSDIETTRKKIETLLFAPEGITRLDDHPDEKALRLLARHGQVPIIRVLDKIYVTDARMPASLPLDEYQPLNSPSLLKEMSPFMEARPDRVVTYRDKPYLTVGDTERARDERARIRAEAKRNLAPSFTATPRLKELFNEPSSSNIWNITRQLPRLSLGGSAQRFPITYLETYHEWLGNGPPSIGTLHKFAETDAAKIAIEQAQQDFETVIDRLTDFNPEVGEVIDIHDIRKLLDVGLVTIYDWRNKAGLQMHRLTGGHRNYTKILLPSFREFYVWRYPRSYQHKPQVG